MGMPVISPSTTTRCQSITDIIESVALEQAALSHILNAEGEKAQKLVTMSATSQQMLDVNKSINGIVNAVTRLEMILQSKLELFEDCLCGACESCLVVTNVSLALRTPNSDTTIIKNSNTNFTITHQNSPGAVVFIVTTTPTVPVALKSAPSGVTLGGDNLIINFTTTPSGTIVLTVGTGVCAFDVTINYQTVE